MGINVINLTKDYGKGRGLFDINLNIKKGETFGIVGINGAGKTTTLREMMGFIKPDKGHIEIDNLNAWKNSAELKKKIGYVPGEIAFPDTKSGQTFLHTQMFLMKIKRRDFVNQLIQLFKIDTTANIKRMSKGMKQKVALVCAFMADPDILLLDEPTTGLDPVMRDAFISLILHEKQKGKTIVMSSHMFNELDPTCVRIAFLKNGKIVDILDRKKIAEIKEYQKVEIHFSSRNDFDTFKKNDFKLLKEDSNDLMITVQIHDTRTTQLLDALKDFKLKNIDFTQEGLDTYFENELEGEK